MKNKILIGIIAGLVILFGAGIVLAWDGDSFSWSRVEEKVAVILAGKVDNPNQGDELGAATVLRTGSSARQASGSFDTATSTFAYWTNDTGRTVILNRISMAFDADDGIFKEAMSPVLVIASSTNTNTTSTATSPLLYESFSTSTAVQYIASSTFTNAWQRWIGNGEKVLFGWQGSMAATTTWTAKNTPSSTGSWAIDYFLK